MKKQGFKPAPLASIDQPRGFTLIELVVYIVVCAIAMQATLILFQSATAKSSNALSSLRALESARSLLEEMDALPVTECERSDADLDCQPRFSPAPGRQRGSSSSPFATVADYSGYRASPPMDILGRPAPGLAGHKIQVTVAPVVIGRSAEQDAVRIDVTVEGPEFRHTLTGYRFRIPEELALPAPTLEAP